ncbi:MAG TPA: H(+)/Cl(-) exchange transporter ClcA [Candidatus Margulisiibacteriota bacterium]|nr:H(+)/Cl(-) exchange transporter ClcA [Candidatus Margulisiibacteriota bacterium]
MPSQPAIDEAAPRPAPGHGAGSGLNLRICAVAAGAGVLCGALAVLFRTALAFAEGTYMDMLVSVYDLPTGGFLVALTVFTGLGALAGWLTSTFAPEASGSGIQHVKDVLDSGTIMRWRRLIPVKFVGGVCSLGGGMSLGREGPTVQMGAAICEAFAQRLALALPVRRALIAAGAGAGLTAAFNAPLAGFVFVLEELRLEMSALTYSAGLIATVAANLVMQAVLGERAVFSVSDAALLPPDALWLFACLGVASGLIGVLFNRGLLLSLDGFARWTRVPRWQHTAAAGALVTLVAWWLPDAIGGGEQVAERLLRSEFAVAEPWRYLTLLLSAKLVLTLVCYGSGAPGGIFAPLLAIGAALGALFGQFAEPLFPDVVVTPALAMAGMVGVFTASVRVPITGVVLILEMTNGQHHLLEFTVTSLAAYLVATWLRDRPIYDALLERDRRR